MPIAFHNAPSNRMQGAISVAESYSMTTHAADAAARVSAPPMKQRKGHRPFTFARDVGGMELIKVPLACGRVSTINAADHARIIGAGFSDQWFLNRDGWRKKNGSYSQYVRLSHAGNNVMVARLVLDVSATDRVRYQDGDATNLRRNNLYTGPKLTAAPDSCNG